MSHGGYHGNIVGLGQSGTTGGPAGMGRPPPQPKKPKQNAKSLMTSDDAYSTGTDTDKKKSTTALTFDDSTPDKGQQSVRSSKELGKNRQEKLKNILFTSNSQTEIDKKIKEENLEGAVNALMKKIPKKKFNIKDDSLTRSVMKTVGVPIDYRTFAYDSFIGTKTPLNPAFGILNTFFSSNDAKTRKVNYKPLTINDFSNSEIASLKFQSINAIKAALSARGNLNYGEQVRFRVGGTKNLNKTLGTVSVYIDKNNDIRMVDTYDFGDKTTTYGITLKQSNGTLTKFKPKNYAQFISAALIATTQGNPPSFDDLVKSTAVLEATDDSSFVDYNNDGVIQNSEKERLEKETGQKIQMNLNLGKVN